MLETHKLWLTQSRPPHRESEPHRCSHLPPSLLILYWKEGVMKEGGWKFRSSFVTSRQMTNYIDYMNLDILAQPDNGCTPRFHSVQKSPQHFSKLVLRAASADLRCWHFQSYPRLVLNWTIGVAHLTTQHHHGACLQSSARYKRPSILLVQSPWL